jgi:hypothetical protein
VLDARDGRPRLGEAAGEQAVEQRAKRSGQVPASYRRSGSSAPSRPSRSSIGVTRSASSCIGTPSSMWVPMGVRRSSMPCCSRSKSTIVCVVCGAATNERTGAGTRTSGPKLTITWTSPEGTSRRRNGCGSHSR